MTPQPIDTAPKDGTLILTDMGFARWSPYWNSGLYWYECDSGGDILRDEYGTPRGEICPALWCPLPEWMKG